MNAISVGLISIYFVQISGYLLVIMNTIGQKSEVLEDSITILGSQFLGILKYTASLNDFQQFLKDVRDAHPKATHHCQAYRIGPESTQDFASDDGEPSGTAGLPMLGVLKKFELVNVSVIVVRYYGGTKLGKKGLIDAYRTSTELVVGKADISAIQKHRQFRVVYPYSASNEIQKVFHHFHVSAISEEFGEKVSLLLNVGVETELEFFSRMSALGHLDISVEKLGYVFV